MSADRWFTWQPRSGTTSTDILTPASAAPNSETSSRLDREASAALKLLNLAGVRIMHGVEQYIVGVWEDLDGPEIRKALDVVGMSSLPVIFLDSAETNLRYKVRSTPGRLPGESFARWYQRAEQGALARQKSLVSV